MATSTRLSAWLEQHGLLKHAELLAQHEIDLDILGELQEQDLEKIGIALGERKRFLKALRSTTQSAAGGVDSVEDKQALPSYESGSGAERRQLTVMFCDLVGSVALSQRLDPEELRALIQAYRAACAQVIERYAGNIARYVGDGILTYFGWPQAHEDDAERALRAALEIVQAVKAVPAPQTLSVHIGIATGPVVVGEQAGESPEAKLAVGTTPNLAARLQALASADEVVIAASTRRLVGNVFQLADLGDQLLKGIAEPVHAWRVEAVSSTEGRFEAVRGGSTLTPFVGREEEVALLLRRWQSAQESEGQVVLLCGEPGIGKSRILQELRERLGEHEFTRLRFQCSPYLSNSAFHSVIEHLERRAGFARDDTGEQKFAKLTGTIAQWLDEPELSTALLASLLSLGEVGQRTPLEFSPQRQKEETLKVLARYVARVAERQPTLILFEDVHWIDPSTLEFLDAAVTAVLQLKALLLITYRPEFQTHWSDQNHVTLLTLNRLGRSQAAAMIQRVTGGKVLPEALLNKIVAKADGVPLFVEELTKAVLESGLVKEGGDKYELAGSLNELDIPSTLQDSLMARLDRHPRAKELAQIGACIGRDFPYDVIAEVSPLTQTQIGESLAQLERSGLLHRSGHAGAVAYTFKHALVQDVAYQSVLKSTRAQLHAKIAHALLQRYPAITQARPELIAHHYSQAGLHELAVSKWIDAGHNELRKSSAQEAVAHLSKGLLETQAMTPSTQRDRLELDVRTALGTGYMAWKGWPAIEVKEAFEPAVKLGQALSDSAALLPVLWGLSVREFCLSSFDSSLSWAHAMIDAGQGDDASDIAIMGHAAAVLPYFWMGNFSAAREHTLSVRRHYSQERHSQLVYVTIHDPKCVAQAWASQAVAILGFADLAAQWCDEQLTLSRNLGHAFNLLFALTTGSGAYTIRREPEVVFTRIDEALQRAREHSLPIIERFTAAEWSCRAYLETGRPQQAFDMANQAAAVWRQAGGTVSISYLSTVAADASRHLGCQAQARSIIDQAIQQMQTIHENAFLAEAYRIKGELAREGNPADPNLARHCFEKALDIARSQAAKCWELRAAKALATLCMHEGKIQQALALLEPVYRWFTEGFDTKDLQEAKALLEELAVRK